MNESTSRVKGISSFLKCAQTQDEYVDYNPSHIQKKIRKRPRKDQVIPVDLKTAKEWNLHSIWERSKECDDIKGFSDSDSDSELILHDKKTPRCNSNQIEDFQSGSKSTKLSSYVSSLLSSSTPDKGHGNVSKHYENESMNQDDDVDEIVNDSPTTTTTPPIEESSIKLSPDKENRIVSSHSSTDIEDNSDSSWHSPELKCVTGTHSKTSDWIQELNLQSPVPHSDSKKGISFSSCDSSVKKKGGRKPLRLTSVPGGLAEQMQKVLEREKSSLAFWSHKSKSDDEYSEDVISITVQVESAVFVHSLLISECHVISDNSLSNSQMKGQSILVYFSSESATQLPVLIGSVVRIFSPWQRINLQVNTTTDDSTTCTVLLSTNYCKLIQEGQSYPRKQISRKKNILMSTSFVNSPSDSPEKKIFTSQKDIRPLRLFDESMKMMTNSTGKCQKDPESVTEAIQVCSHTSVTVSAVVRALYHNNQEYERLGINDERWVVLLEDKQKVFMELVINLEDTTAWKDLIVKGLNKKFKLDNICFVKRVNRYQRPKLFCLIDSLSLRGYAQSDDICNTPYEESSLGTCSSNLCCFILKTQSNSHWESISDIRIFSEADVELLSNKRQEGRLDCVARIVCSNIEVYSDDDDEDIIKDTNHWLFAIIHSPCVLKNSPQLVKILIKPGFVLKGISSLLTSSGTCVTINNVFITKRVESDDSVSFVLDSYSLILPQDTDMIDDQQTIHPIISLSGSDIRILIEFRIPYLPPLSEKFIITDTLVSLTGKITGVDERNAFIWLTCTLCESNVESITHNR